MLVKDFQKVIAIEEIPVEVTSSLPSNHLSFPSDNETNQKEG